MKKIPDKLVVLTFDDGCRSDVEFVAPLLGKLGFGATFYVNDATGTPENWPPRNYMTWEQVGEVHRMGFEIGNHTARHPGVGDMSKEDFLTELELIERQCVQHGIARPTTFCYPGFQFGRTAVQVLAERGYLFARRGPFPEYEYGDGTGSRGPAYDPTRHHPLLVPATGYSGPSWGFADLQWAVEQAKDGRVCVLNFHGVPDLDHPWGTTDQADFERYMAYLRDEGCTVIGMNDLAAYVDPAGFAHDPFATFED